MTFWSKFNFGPKHLEAMFRASSSPHAYKDNFGWDLINLKLIVLWMTFFVMNMKIWCQWQLNPCVAFGCRQLLGIKITRLLLPLLELAVTIQITIPRNRCRASWATKTKRERFWDTLWCVIAMTFVTNYCDKCDKTVSTLAQSLVQVDQTAGI